MNEYVQRKRVTKEAIKQPKRNISAAKKLQNDTYINNYRLAINLENSKDYKVFCEGFKIRDMLWKTYLGNVPLEDSLSQVKISYVFTFTIILITVLFLLF